MDIDDIVVPLIWIIIGGLILYFPVYVVFFIPRRIWARKIGPGAGPSILTLVLYFLVVALIFAASIPQFLTFGAKALTSEARQNLGAIYTCQIAYYGESETYAGGPEALSLINWAPEGRNLYAYYCGDDMVGNSKRVPIKVIPGPDWPYPVRPGASATGFTCMAVGNIDGDDFLDVWSMNDARVLSKVRDDIYDGEHSGAPIAIGLAVLFPLLLLSFVNDRRRRKKAMVRAAQTATKGSEE